MTLLKTAALAALLTAGLAAGSAMANDNVANPGTQAGSGASGIGSSGTVGDSGKPGSLGTTEGRSTSGGSMGAGPADAAGSNANATPNGVNRDMK